MKYTSLFCIYPFECNKEIISIFKFTICFITYIHALRDIIFNFTKCLENHQRYCQWCLVCRHIHLCFVALLWYNQLLTLSAFLGLVSFTLSATDLSAVPPPPMAAGHLVMAVVDTWLLFLSFREQHCIFSWPRQPWLQVAAVMEIAVPTMPRVATVWSMVLVKLRWGWPPRSVPVIFKLHWWWNSYQMTMPIDHWLCVCLLYLNKLFIKILLHAQTVQSPSVHQDVAVMPGGGGVGTHHCWSHGAMTMMTAVTTMSRTPWLPARARTMTTTTLSSLRRSWLLLWQQTTVEPTHVGVHWCWCRCTSVAGAPGGGGAGTHCHQSCGARMTTTMMTMTMTTRTLWLTAWARMMTTMTLSSLWLSTKQQSNNNDDNFDDNNDNKDIVIASTSKNND